MQVQVGLRGPALHLTKLSVGQFCNIKLCWVVSHGTIARLPVGSGTSSRYIIPSEDAKRFAKLLAQQSQQSRH